MALACPRCATLNPDSNAFCQSCGGPLGAATAPTPQPQPAPGGATPLQPAAAPLPTAPAGGTPPPGPATPSSASYYATPGQSQFYTPPPPPPGGAGPVHRLPRNAVYAIVAAAVLVIAGVGAIVALAGKPSKPPVVPTPLPTSQPTAPPAPTGTPGPTSRPTSAPTPTPGPNGNTINAGFAVVPQIQGFTAQNPSSDTVELDANDKSGIVFVQVAQVSGISANQQLTDSLLAQDQKSSPDAARCQPDKDGGTFTGAGGAQIPTRIIAICETVTPQNGQAFPAVDFYFAGVAKDASGSPVAVLVNLFAAKDTFNNFAKEVPDSFYNGIQFNATP